jgi:hypothetical protein
MSLEEKVKLVDSSDATVDNRARSRVPVMICVGSFRGVKSSVMPLATNDHRKLWTISGLGGVKLPERCPNLWNFVIDDYRELALKGGNI